MGVTAIVGRTRLYSAEKDSDPRVRDDYCLVIPQLKSLASIEQIRYRSPDLQCYFLGYVG